MTNHIFDWDAIESQQQADAEMEHGFPLLVSDWRHQWRVAREEYGSSREDQLRNIVELREFVVDVRPGSLTTDQLLALFDEEWPEQ